MTLCVEGCGVPHHRCRPVRVRCWHLCADGAGGGRVLVLAGAQVTVADLAMEHASESRLGVGHPHVPVCVVDLQGTGRMPGAEAH